MAELPKKYEISSLDKLCNVVTPENVERLSLDFILWLHHYSATIQKIRNDFPKETKGRSNTKICKSSFTWIDDGNNDILGAKVINNETGEIIGRSRYSITKFSVYDGW